MIKRNVSLQEADAQLVVSAVCPIDWHQNESSPQYQLPTNTVQGYNDV